MTSKITKWGNSFGVRIPKEIITDLQLEEGVAVSIHQKKDTIELKPIKEEKSPVYSLKKLCDQIKPATKHELMEFDKPMGREAW